MTEPSKPGNDDPFLVQYQPSELKIVSEFLSTWLPFLSRDLCRNCTKILSDRILFLSELKGEDKSRDFPKMNDNFELPNSNCCSGGNCDNNSLGSSKEEDDLNSIVSWKDGTNGWYETPKSEASTSGLRSEWCSGMSWADMTQEDELAKEEKELEQQELNTRVVNVNDSAGGLRMTKVVGKPTTLPWEKREYIRFMNVKRKMDFMCFEKVNGKLTNILQGLELHTGIFSDAEQKRIVNLVYSHKEKGEKGELKAERTYSAPQKWMKGKGRVTLQFGCCYNYATDKNGNPPGIIQDEMVDPMPDLFKVIIRRLVRWHVMPPTCVPDSCIVNIYEEGDCIPPHIDSHDFVRPFCTVSFLSACNIVFGSRLKIVGPGDFDGPIAIPLPVGSVLVLNGNGADVAKHCVPSVPTKRISITFRKMDKAKLPIGFVPEPGLQGIQPLPYELDKTRLNSPKSEPYMKRWPLGKEGKKEGRRPAENDSQSEPYYSGQSRQPAAYQWRIKENIDRADG